ncbi:MAG: DUF1016 family protein [Bacilli bacterium]|nr:DUF1016 family protein [Bacilli bacterium]
MNYYNQIKEELINNEIYKKAKDYSKNRNDLSTYYNVGKILCEAGKHYGESIIKDYSIRLTNELGKGYSQRNLRNMRQFYKISQKWQTVSAKLSWSHLCEILWFEDSKFLYYIKTTENQNLSIRQLREKIKNKEYERLDETTKNKLITQEELKINDFIKNPIVLKNTYNLEKITEKYLKQIILEQLNTFMKELGDGFSYVDNEYKIKIGDRYNYIDLLLYNIKYNCYVVAELKVTELKKEHIGQIQTYMNYIDKHIKRVEQNKTIGIIVSAKDNKIILEYCSDPRIYETKFILN